MSIIFLKERASKILYPFEWKAKNDKEIPL